VTLGYAIDKKLFPKFRRLGTTAIKLRKLVRVTTRDYHYKSIFGQSFALNLMAVSRNPARIKTLLDKFLL